jgi:transcriptional regulator with XRE-family HTH domain
MPASFHSKQYEIFTALLREVREDLGVSQVELALALGVPQTTVSKCETGVRRVDVVELYDWLRALNVDFDAFMQRLTTLWEAHAARSHIAKGHRRKP